MTGVERRRVGCKRQRKNTPATSCTVIGERIVCRPTKRVSFQVAGAPRPPRVSWDAGPRNLYSILGMRRGPPGLAAQQQPMPRCVLLGRVCLAIANRHMPVVEPAVGGVVQHVTPDAKHSNKAVMANQAVIHVL